MHKFQYKCDELTSHQTPSSLILKLLKAIFIFLGVKGGDPSLIRYHIYHSRGKGVVQTDRTQIVNKTMRNVLESLKLITPIVKLSVPENMFVVFLPGIIIF
jgi:hypothetical protein